MTAAVVAAAAAAAAAEDEEEKLPWLVGGGQSIHKHRAANHVDGVVVHRCWAQQVQHAQDCDRQRTRS
jgi:hypothetical protein